MAGRGRASGFTGRGLVDDDAGPLLLQAAAARRAPGFNDPFAPPGDTSAKPATIQGYTTPVPGGPSDASPLPFRNIEQRSLGWAVTLCYALPAFALRGVQAFAASEAVTKLYSQSKNVNTGRRDAGWVTLGAFGSLIVASYAQLAAAHFGDGLRTRFGRRRLVLALLAPLTAAAAFLMVSPPTTLQSSSAFYAITFGLLMVFVETSTTMLDALGTELSALQHSDVRTNLFSAQATAGIAGAGCASVAALVIGFEPTDGIPPGNRTVIGIILAALLVVTHIAVCLGTSEAPPSALPRKQFRHTRTSFVPGLRWIMRNTQWKIYICATAPLNLIAELMAIIPVVYVYLLHCGMDEEMDKNSIYTADNCRPGQALDWACKAMIVYAGVAMFSAGVVAPLFTRRFSKLATLRGLVVLAFLFSLFGWFAGDEGSSRAVFVGFTALLGLAWGGIQSLKPALLSDVIDYGELVCGARQEGTYQAMSKLIELWFTFLGRAFPIAILADVCTESTPAGNGTASSSISESDIEVIRSYLRVGFLGCIPAVFTLFAALWLSWFQLNDITTADKIRRFLGQRRETGSTHNLYDPISHTPISAFTHAAPTPVQKKTKGRGGRTGRRGGGTTPLTANEQDAASYDEDDDDATSEDLASQKRRANNYMLYFSHADLTLISRYGTAKFLALFGLQLMLWLAYAVVLVVDAYTLVEKALKDLENAPEIWPANQTSIGAFDPELNPEQGRLAWSLIIVFIASAFVCYLVYNFARLHAAYWLTMQPRREEFRQIVAARMLEREAEMPGILAWIAHKNTGKGAVLVHICVSVVRHTILPPERSLVL